MIGIDTKYGLIRFNNLYSVTNYFSYLSRRKVFSILYNRKHIELLNSVAAITCTADFDFRCSIIMNSNELTRVQANLPGMPIFTNIHSITLWYYLKCLQSYFTGKFTWCQLALQSPIPTFYDPRATNLQLDLNNNITLKIL